MHKEHGLLYTGNLRFIGVQLGGAFAIVIYSGCIAYLFFSILRHMNRFRIGDTIEIAGMDLLDHGVAMDSRISGTTATKA